MTELKTNELNANESVTKGTTTKENLVCIVCPMGCLLEVETRTVDGKKDVLSVAHNECKRGDEYAHKELTEPMRTLTTTVVLHDGKDVLLPVKTQGEVPKHLLFHCMEVLKRVSVQSPVTMGDIILPDILGTGIDVVASKNA